jgi:ribosomal protein L37AE/L43A
MSRTTDGPVWRCDTCGHEFEEPRWIHSDRGVRSDTQAGKLDAMDPDTEIYNPEKVGEDE